MEASADIFTLLKVVAWSAFLGWTFTFFGLTIWSYQAQQQFMNLYRQRSRQSFPADFTHVSLLEQVRLSREIEGQLAEAQLDPKLEEIRMEVRRRRSLTLKVFLLGTATVVLVPLVAGALLLAFGL